MLMTLPDGTAFRLLPLDEITLNDQILCQQTTGVGPMQLQARIGANMAVWRSLAPVMRDLEAAAGEAEQQAAMFAFEAAVAEKDIDLFAEGVWVWLSRRAAGEREITLQQACDFSLFTARRELEPAEQAAADAEAKAEVEAAADPTLPSSAAGRSNGAAPNRAARRAVKSTSKTT